MTPHADGPSPVPPKSTRHTTPLAARPAPVHGTGTLSDRDVPQPQTKTLSAPADAAATSSGLLRVGAYEVLEELGRGGMGVVYRARHRTLGHEVALKMILSGGHADAAELARFRLEAAAVARLHHPGIVHIHEFGTHDGNPFFSLELVDGGISRTALKNGPLARTRHGGAGREAGAGHAARPRSRHRPPRPQAGQRPHDAARAKPKVADFGLAKEMGVDAGLSQTGAIMGTPVVHGSGAGRRTRPRPSVRPRTSTPWERSCTSA